MAQIWIDNGVNVDPAWVGHLAFSVDGTRWETISKAGLDVRPVFMNANSSSPTANKTRKCVIHLVRGDVDNSIIRFDLEDVQNQAGWTGGASLIVDCIAAISDITTWLSPAASGGSATEATLLAILAELQEQKTPTSIVSTGVTVVPIGASEVSIFNNGATAATTNGVSHPAGISKTFGFENEIDSTITTDGGGVNSMLIDYMI